MREYSIVRPRFWIGETGKQIRKLGRDAQVIAFYLFTCPSANMLGLYYLAMPTLCHETASPLQGASKALRSLHECKFAHYDPPSECVFVPNMAREQIGERLKRKDNRHIAVLRELQQLRKAPYFNDFLNRYRDAFELQDIEFEPNLVSPLEAPSKPLRSQDQDQDQDQEQEQEQEQDQTGERRNGNARAPRSPATRLPDDFQLTDERRAYALSKHVEPEPTFEAFVAYWGSKATANTKLDWDKTWHSWVLKEAKDAKLRAAPRPGRFDEIMAERRNGR